jgi:hypothetical protein
MRWTHREHKPQPSIAFGCKDPDAGDVQAAIEVPGRDYLELAHRGRRCRVSDGVLGALGLSSRQDAIPAAAAAAGTLACCPRMPCARRP